MGSSEPFSESEGSVAFRPSSAMPGISESIFSFGDTDGVVLCESVVIEGFSLVVAVVPVVSKQDEEKKEVVGVNSLAV